MTTDETDADQLAINEWYETAPEGSVDWSRAYFAVLFNHVIIVGAMTPLTALIVEMSRDAFVSLDVKLPLLTRVYLLDIGPLGIVAISIFATLAIGVMALIRRQMLAVVLSSMTCIATAVFLLLGISSAVVPLFDLMREVQLS
jgi:hypothetical protein